MSDSDSTAKQKIEKHKALIAENFRDDEVLCSLVMDTIDFAYDGGFLDGTKDVLDKIGVKLRDS